MSKSREVVADELRSMLEEIITANYRVFRQLYDYFISPTYIFSSKERVNIREPTTHQQFSKQKPFAICLSMNFDTLILFHI